MVIPTPTAGYDNVQQAFAPQTLAGLGDCGDCLQYDADGYCSLTDTTNCGTSGDTSSGSITLSPLVPGQANTTGTVANPIYASSTSPTVTTGVSAGQLALLNTIAQNAGTIGKELAITPGTVVSASGAVSQQNPGYPIAGSNTLGIGGTASSSLMMMLLLGLGVVLVKNASKH